METEDWLTLTGLTLAEVKLTVNRLSVGHREPGVHCLKELLAVSLLSLKLKPALV